MKSKQISLNLFDDEIYEATQDEIATAKGTCVRMIFENHLLHYGIDDIYIKKFKNECVLLSLIENELMKQKNYEDYKQELYDLCKKYLNVVDENIYDFGIVGVQLLSDMSIRHMTIKRHGPAYCLEMIPFEVFKYGRKDS